MPGPVIVPYRRDWPRDFAAVSVRLASALGTPDVKDPAVDLIYFAAEQWASVSSWRLADGPGGEA